MDIRLTQSAESHFSGSITAMMPRSIRSPAGSRITRLVGRTLLDRAAVRDAVLMVPAARHITPLALDATTEPMAVTFDVSVLLACKAGSSTGGKR